MPSPPSATYMRPKVWRSPSRMLGLLPSAGTMICCHVLPPLETSTEYQYWPLDLRTKTVGLVRPGALLPKAKSTAPLTPGTATMAVPFQYLKLEATFQLLVISHTPPAWPGTASSLYCAPVPTAATSVVQVAPPSV